MHWISVSYLLHGHMPFPVHSYMQGRGVLSAGLRLIDESALSCGQMCTNSMESYRLHTTAIFPVIWPTDVSHPPICPYPGDSRQQKLKFGSCRIPIHSAIYSPPLKPAMCEIIHFAGWPWLSSMSWTDSLCYEPGEVLPDHQSFEPMRTPQPSQHTSKAMSIHTKQQKRSNCWPHLFVY